jgi:predicted glycosyl hydrolase (DUF1957 family)
LLIWRSTIIGDLDDSTVAVGMSTTPPLNEVLAKILTDQLVLTLLQQLVARVKDLEKHGQDTKNGHQRAISIADQKRLKKATALIQQLMRRQLEKIA